MKVGHFFLEEELFQYIIVIQSFKYMLSITRIILVLPESLVMFSGTYFAFITDGNGQIAALSLLSERNRSTSNKIST